MASMAMRRNQCGKALMELVCTWEAKFFMFESTTCSSADGLCCIRHNADHFSWSIDT